MKSLYCYIGIAAGDMLGYAVEYLNEPSILKNIEKVVKLASSDIFCGISNKFFDDFL